MKRDEDLANIADVLKQSRLQSKATFEQQFARRLRQESFKFGDLVLVRNSQVEKEMNRKHKPRYLGPYEVVRQTRGGSYVLRELNDGSVILRPQLDRMIRELGHESQEDKDTWSDNMDDF
ncbi:hypothetical protein JR316_0008199 [Psilocybe cubensis]|uniref:Uncharacterized protein n=2 Tax=Psilocybe cubensis TaxID=181762 RepID=A0ACB8GVI3_PSICU|nr:hypothetical protein JR316_0008199 [Psilocybe cubensis]KAH9479604.1 hypothetical protein JR316_0008199 [Psilocybe cubensis]